MAAKPVRVSASSGVVALVTVLAVLILGYAGYLVRTDQALKFQAEMLGYSPFMYKPAAVLQMISDGGYQGTVAAVALKVIHTLFAATIIFTITSLALSKYGGAKAAVRKSLENPDVIRQQIFECPIPGSEMLVSVPPNRDARSGAVIEGIQDKNPYNQIFFRIDAKPLKLARKPATAIEQLQVDILEMLAAHPDVPAAIGNHHADASLMSHSKDIAKKVKAVMDRLGRHDHLSTLVGLAHDLDKLLAYQKKDGVWGKNKNATHHNSYSAYIVQHIPTFSKLPKEDQHVLTMVLRYYHHPDQLPLNVGARIEHLIQAVREADGWGTRDERTTGIANAKENPNTSSHLVDGITQFFADADINRFKGGQLADGWTVNAVEYVIIPASTMLEGLHKFLPAELTRQLRLNVDTRIFGHPALEIIIDTLREMGLLMDEYKDMKTTTGLFDVKVGVLRFSACLLIDKNSLLKLLPTTVPKWGMSEFGLRVRHPTPKGQQDEGEDRDSGE